MTRLETICERFGTAELLEAVNVEALYDRALTQQPVSEAASLELRGQIPFYPVVLAARTSNVTEAKRYTAIPLGDHQARKGGLYMGMLVGRSTVVSGLTIIEHFPQPCDTPLPTSINAMMGGDVLYPPITGFLLYRKRPRGRLDLSLLAQHGENPPFAIPLGLMRSKRMLGQALLYGVKRAEYKNEQRLLRLAESHNIE